MSLIFVRLHWN